MVNFKCTTKGSNMILIEGGKLKPGTYIYRVTDANGNELGKGKLEKL